MLTSNDEKQKIGVLAAAASAALLITQTSTSRRTEWENEVITEHRALNTYLLTYSMEQSPS